MAHNECIRDEVGLATQTHTFEMQIKYQPNILFLHNEHDFVDRQSASTLDLNEAGEDGVARGGLLSRALLKFAAGVHP